MVMNAKVATRQHTGQKEKVIRRIGEREGREKSNLNRIIGIVLKLPSLQIRQWGRFEHSQ